MLELDGTHKLGWDTPTFGWDTPTLGWDTPKLGWATSTLGSAIVKLSSSFDHSWTILSQSNAKPWSYCRRLKYFVLFSIISSETKQRLGRRVHPSPRILL